MVQPRFLFAPGAGAPSTSPWMQRYATLLAQLGTVRRFDYDYVLAGKRAPDRLNVLLAAHARELTKWIDETKGQGGPLVLIGKSMGGRVSCHLAQQVAVAGVVCLGYPLKAAGKAQTIRDQVLLQMNVPVLFVQGTRDPLCPLDLLASVRQKMTARTALYVVQSGDHSLQATKTELRQTGTTQANVEAQILDRIRAFCCSL